MTDMKSQAYEFPIVRRVNTFAFDAQVPFEEGTFLDYCREFVGDGAADNTLDFRQRQIDISYNFDDTEQLENAMRYFLSYVMARGYAPMNFIDVPDPDLDYGPITKYGLRPQEIIDNIIADWRSRGCQPFEPFEVMFGWERDCGLFMEDGEEAN